MKYPLQHQDINPGLVIGQDQIPPRTIHGFHSLNVPTPVADDLLVLVVDPDPVFGNGVQHAAAFSHPGL